MQSESHDTHQKLIEQKLLKKRKHRSFSSDKCMLKMSGETEKRFKSNLINDPREEDKAQEINEISIGKSKLEIMAETKSSSKQSL